MNKDAKKVREDAQRTVKKVLATVILLALAYYSYSLLVWLTSAYIMQHITWCLLLLVIWFRW